MKDHRYFALAALSFAIFSIASHTATAAGKEPSALIPNDAMFYIGIRDCDAMGEAIKRTAMWRMFEDPATKDLKQSWDKIGSKLKKFAAKKLNLASPKQLDVLPHGALGVYVTLTPPKEEGAEPEFLAALVMEMGDDAKKARIVIDAIIQKSIDYGGKKDKRELAGGEVVSVSFESMAKVSDDVQINTDSPLAAVLEELVELIGDDLPGGIPKETLEVLLSEFELPDEVVFAFRKDIVALASSQEVAANVLRTLKSDSEGSYARSKAIKSLGRRFGKKSQMEMVADIPSIVETFSRQDEEVKSVLSALGVDTFGPMLSVADMTPSPGIESRTLGFMKIGDKNKGLGKIFMMSNSKVTAPATVTGNSAGFAFLNLNPAEMFEEIIAIVSRIDPAEGEEFRSSLIVPQADGSTFDIRKDLVAHLVGPVVGSFSTEKPYGHENYDFFMSIGHKSREAWDKVVSMIPPGVSDDSRNDGCDCHGRYRSHGWCFDGIDRSIIYLVGHDQRRRRVHPPRRSQRWWAWRVS